MVRGLYARQCAKKQSFYKASGFSAGWLHSRGAGCAMLLTEGFLGWDGWTVCEVCEVWADRWAEGEVKPKVL